jgi:eukaryotic-like serine/threonine-protein kinase
MESERRQQISDLYNAALERQPGERTAFLKEACDGDEALRQEVESLLGYQSASARFLETPAVKVFPGALRAAPTTEMVGRQLGPYKILAPLGAGGMGEVYRARDSKLGREVAIKVLPPHFTADPERRVRFAREARSLATLNHPHIGAIYGLEEVEGVTALVLELVEGPTLADRLERGPLPVGDALAIARQIADALDAAHEKGVIHRDLKPANIVLQGGAGASGPMSGDARAKVLDFGLAKTMAVGLEGDATQSPSRSHDGTVEGRILGTPAYMSPEQARAQTVDKRTDVWAFGCVLFEMLSGRRPFGGDTVSDTFVSILEREPDWSALPAGTPAAVRTLILRCLQKDPRKRLRDIADAFLEIDGSDPTLTSPAGARLAGGRAATGSGAARMDPCGAPWHCNDRSRWPSRCSDPSAAGDRRSGSVHHRGSGQLASRRGCVHWGCARLLNFSRRSTRRGPRVLAGAVDVVGPVDHQASVAPTRGNGRREQSVLVT